MDGFYSFYRDEYYKYRDTAEGNIGKPGYDEIGLPLAKINDYIEQKIVFLWYAKIYGFKFTIIFYWSIN